MARMYHPKTGAEITVPDVDDVIAVHAASGWKVAPEPEVVIGREPEPVTYEPVTAKPTKKATTKSEE